MPQGALLGVLLFVIQINDLHKCLKFSNSILYADDTTIYVIGRNLRFMKIKLQKDLISLESWLLSNRLSLNVKKTKIMYFHRGLHHDNIDIQMNNVTLEVVDEFKLLGLTIDHKLKFEKHCEDLLANLLQTNYICRKLSTFVPLRCLKHVYFGLFHSKLTYGIGIWYSLVNHYYRDRLQKLQNKILRVIDGAPYYSHIGPILKKYRVLNVNDLGKLDNLKFMHRVIFDTAPKPLINLLNYKKEQKNSRTKSIVVMKHKSDVLNKSFIVSSTILWNKLKLEIKMKENYSSFKKAVKSAFLHLY